MGEPKTMPLLVQYSPTEVEWVAVDIGGGKTGKLLNQPVSIKWRKQVELEMLPEIDWSLGRPIFMRIKHG